MLGPIVALLLLTSPAAGPVDQLCMPWDSPSACQQTQDTARLQRQVDDQQRQLDTMQQRERARQTEFTLPPVTLPSGSSYPSGTGGLFRDAGSTGTGTCALCTR